MKKKNQWEITWISLKWLLTMLTINDDKIKMSRNVGIENLNKRICLKRIMNIMASYAQNKNAY